MLVAVMALAVSVFLAAGASAEDPRTKIALPADMRPAFMEHMRHHMDALDDVMTELAASDFRAAAQVAREELVPGAGAGFGRYLPIEFREMGLGMHRAAAEFADVVEEAQAPPTPADWQKAVAALQSISAHCRACHSAFRME